jgi:hypothetical protein
MWAAGGFKAGSADRRQRRGRITESPKKDIGIQKNKKTPF